MINARQLEQEGRQAFKAGLSVDANPYHWVSLKAGGPAKVAWWLNGWKKAALAAQSAADSPDDRHSIGTGLR